MKWIDWSLAIAAAAHIFEEFVWPGGFKQWWIGYRPGTAGHVSNRFLVFINALLMVMAIVIAFAVHSRVAMALPPGSPWRHYCSRTRFSTLPGPLRRADIRRE